MTTVDIGVGRAFSARARRVSRGLVWQSRLRRKLIVLDTVAGIAGCLGTVLLRYNGQQALLSNLDYRFLALATAALWLVVVALSGGYQARVLELGSLEFRRIGNAAVRLLALLVLLGFAVKADVSRSVVVGSVASTAILGLLLRWVARTELHRQRRSGRCLHRVLAVGNASDVQSLIAALERTPHAGLRVVAACSVDAADVISIDVPVLGTVDQAADVVDLIRADTVAVAGGGASQSRMLRELAWSLEGLGVDLLVAPALTDVAGPRVTVRPVDSVPLLEVQEPVFDGPRRIVKAIFDRSVALVMLAVLALPLTVIAAIVKLTSPGPAVFRQLRVGRDGELFTIWKFRTMVDSERPDGNDADGPLFKLRADPRVTAIGRVLRRWSLDEMPQLVNVIRGDMSLVGPRPPLPAEVAAYGDDVRRRLLVKPGLTGLWQVSGRSDLPWEECVRLDLRYVENWSISLDLLILARTTLAVIRGVGAY
jgi:exopolysaccharide biosynthesis polyprenyl glycosylphosphotransferase